MLDKGYCSLTMFACETLYRAFLFVYRPIYATIPHPEDAEHAERPV